MVSENLTLSALKTGENADCEREMLFLGSPICKAEKCCIVLMDVKNNFSAQFAGYLGLFG